MHNFETGIKGVNKQGLSYEVIDGKISKKTRIRFSDDGAELVTTKAYLRQGLPIHPTWGVWKSGDIHLDNKGNKFELVEQMEDRWKIRWLKDGVESVKWKSTIKAGSVKHPTDGIPQVGETWKTDSHGNITILENNGAFDVKVQFEDGTVTQVNAAQIRTGSIGHPTSGLVVGKEYATNSGWKMKVLEYKDPYNVLLEFQDGHQQWCEASDVKKGSIKPVYQPSVAGVGFFGHGKYEDYRKSGEFEKPPKVVVDYWRRMLTRCYDPEEIMKSESRYYIYVEVCNSWFNFHNFAEWALSQPNWNVKFELDKDLIGGGIEYSPERCCFLPSEINQFLSDSWRKTVHKSLPTGVQYIKPVRSNAKDGYVARCHTENGREYLGYYDTPEEAHLVYKKRKEEYAVTLAEKYKDKIIPIAYERLMEYKVPKYSTFNFELSCYNKIERI